MQFTLYRVTVFENRSAINQQAQITTSASSTSARLGGQRESRASETNKHVIEIVFINGMTITSVRQMQSCKHIHTL